MKNVFQKGIVHAVRAMKRHMLHQDIDSQRLLETDTLFSPLLLRFN